MAPLDTNVSYNQDGCILVSAGMKYN